MPIDCEFLHSIKKIHKVKDESESSKDGKL